MVTHRTEAEGQLGDFLTGRTDDGDLMTEAVCLQTPGRHREQPRPPWSLYIGVCSGGITDAYPVFQRGRIRQGQQDPAEHV
jgi:hypothetical protein